MLHMLAIETLIFVTLIALALSFNRSIQTQITHEVGRGKRIKRNKTHNSRQVLHYLINNNT